MKTIKIEKNIQPILSITKNLIKKTDNFNNYYIYKNNYLYRNQIPLLDKHSHFREAISLKKYRNDDFNKFSIKLQNESKEENEEQKLSSINSYLSNIRKPDIRSQKLPPLCPFYSQRGKLLPDVIATSKIYFRNILMETDSSYNINTSMSSNSLGKFILNRPLGCITSKSLKKINHKNLYKTLEINFDEFQKEILFDPKYNSLKYNNCEIFGHKEFYEELIKGLVEEILILTEDDCEKQNNKKENEEIKKEKVFEWGKNKSKIYLTLKSLNIKIKEVISNDNNKNDNIDKNKNIGKEINCFEYNLPLNLLPLFYYKGFDKFKLFILSFFRFDEEKQKFEINENIQKIINNLLKNCKDVKIKEENEDEVKEMEFKKNMSINKSKIEKKSSKNYSNYKSMAKTMNLGIGVLQNQVFLGTNIDIVSKKKIKKEKINLYPREKKNADFINYRTFRFYWNVSNKIFSVNIEMPLIIFNVPSNNIMIKQYIDYELLFYLFKINFDTWDFYVIKYISSFKKFRILLSQIAAITPKKNMTFYLEKYKNKNFEDTDCKIINIITSKFLIEKENINEDKKNAKFFDIKKIKLNKIHEKSEDKKREETEEENENIINRKGENNEEGIRDKKDDEEREIVNPIQTEETGQPILTTNSQNDYQIDNKTLNEKQLNSILEQKCFIALVTLNNTEKSISKEYTIHFNYAQFTKFKSMERYMIKPTFLIKFLNINYEKSIIGFDYESLNAFEEMKWINEIEKYNLNYESEVKKENIIINKEEVKMGIPLVNSKNIVEFAGPIKGTSIVIEIKQPIILLRHINKDGKIDTKEIEVFEEEENKLSINENNDIINLTKNIFEISIYHKKKEIEDTNNKEIADNILLYAFKKKCNK